MSAESRSDGPKAQAAQRSFAGKVLFAAGFLFVAATTVGGAFACVAVLLKAVDSSSLSGLVPEDGRIALIIGGIAIGGVTGLMLPLGVLAMVKGNEEKPRVGPVATLRRVLAVIVFDLYLLLVALLVAQLGRFLPQGVVNIVSVFAVGFSWMPLAMLPWEKLGLGDLVGKRITARGRPGSPQSE
ncbi:hypothetical protein ACW4TU_28135 [Streptomyces sp. QTS52]